MSQNISNQYTLLLLVAANFLTACSHTGEVHHENLYEMIPAASDRTTEELLEETNTTSLNRGPGGYR